MKNRMLLFVFLSAIVFSCKKEGVDEPGRKNISPIVVRNDFYPLTIGSYWVYDFDRILPDGTVEEIDLYDTIRIVGDTVIGADTFAVFSSDVPYPDAVYFRRDDGGEIISHSNSLVCPPHPEYPGEYNSHYGFNGQDTVYHYWEEFYGYVEVKGPIGLHTCIQMTAYHDYYPGYGAGIVADTHYFSTIGELQRSFSYASGIRVVGTLITYRIGS